jgi:hypothetical protein
MAFANAPTTTSHDRMLVLQPEVHGILSLVGVTAILLPHCSLFSLREPGASVCRTGRCIERDYSTPAEPPPLPTRALIGQQVSPTEG